MEDKTVQIVLDSRKMTDSCIEFRSRMSKLEELLNQTLVE